MTLSPSEGVAADEAGVAERFLTRANVALLPPRLRALCVELASDPERAAFLESIAQHRRGRARHFVRSALRGVFSDFDLNALFETYPLFLMSAAPWQQLLADVLPASPRKLLDIGAGDGEVTRQLAPLFESVTATETSRMMARSLKKRGFSVHLGDVTHGVPSPLYDAISLLNVLDRTSRPLTLLDSVHAGLADHGVVIVALALPVAPFFYASGGTRPPLEWIGSTATTWEAALVEVVEQVLEPHGFEPRRIARVPYLSGGDPKQELYALDDAVIVCRKRAS